MEIQVKLIFTNPDQPRKEFNDKKLSELAASIKENGLLQPISVIPNHNGYMIVAGERRFRAVEKLGWKKISAQVIDNSKDIEVLSLIENIQREQLGPLEKADYIKRLHDRYQNIPEVSRRLGISTSTVKENLHIANEQSQYLRNLLKSKSLTPSVYRYIRRLNNDTEKQLLIEKYLQGGYIKGNRDEISKIVTMVHDNHIPSFIKDALLSLPQVTTEHITLLMTISKDHQSSVLKRIIKEHITVDDVKQIIWTLQNPFVKKSKDNETVNDFILNMFNQLNTTLEVLDERVIPYITNIDKKYLKTNLREIRFKITSFEEKLQDSPTIHRIK